MFVFRCLFNMLIVFRLSFRCLVYVMFVSCVVVVVVVSGWGYNTGQGLRFCCVFDIWCSSDVRVERHMNFRSALLFRSA